MTDAIIDITELIHLLLFRPDCMRLLEVLDKSLSSPGWEITMCEEVYWRK
jgi:hypothetical protein